MNQGLEDLPVDFTSLVASAERAIDTLDYNAAAYAYSAAAALRPDDARVLGALGEVRFQIGDLEGAEVALRAAVALPDVGYGAWLYLGQILEGSEAAEALGRGVAALDALLKADARAGSEASRLRRELSDAHCALAELWMTDRCDEPAAEGAAAAAARAAVNADSENPEAHRALAAVLLCQSRPPSEAAPHLRRAAALCDALCEAEEVGDDSTADVAPASMRAAAAAASAAAGVASGVTAGAPAWAPAPPPLSARKELAKTCMEVELYDEALGLLARLTEEDDADLEIAYLTGEALFLSGDGAAAAEVVAAALQKLDDAIARISAAVRRARARSGKGKGAVKRRIGMPKPANIDADDDGLNRFDLDELVAQRTMLAKLADVIAGAAPPAVAGAGEKKLIH